MINTKLFCQALNFAAHAASKQDVRYYLMGVRIEWEGDTLEMIGTDGSRLAHIKLRTSLMSDKPVASIIKLEDVKRIVATIGKEQGDVTLNVQNEGRTIHIASGYASLNLTSVEGVYPDWRRIVPPKEREVGVMPPIDAHLISSACLAVAKFGVDYKKAIPLNILPGGNADPVVVTLPEGTMQDPSVIDCRVIISPMRV